MSSAVSFVRINATSEGSQGQFCGWVGVGGGGVGVMTWATLVRGWRDMHTLKSHVSGMKGATLPMTHHTYLNFA